MYRQGDILIVKADKVPKGSKRLHHTVLERGEATGHKHELAENAILWDKNGNVFFETDEPTPLNHEEHDTIIIPEGTYQVIRQREFDGEHIRYVRD